MCLAIALVLLVPQASATPVAPVPDSPAENSVPPIYNDGDGTYVIATWDHAIPCRNGIYMAASYGLGGGYAGSDIGSTCTGHIWAGCGSTWRVKYQDSSGWSAWSELRHYGGSCETPPLPPPPPPPAPPTPPPEWGPTPPSPDCSDGIDDDGDGMTDAADPGCTGDPTHTEAPWNAPEPTPAGPSQCNDGIDNDGDGYVDMQDPSCDYNHMSTESPVNAAPPPPECGDGIDNDGDGYADSNDPECQHEPYTVESPWNAPPQCTDGTDDDGDGLIDAADPGCGYYPFDREDTPAPPPSPILSISGECGPQPGRIVLTWTAQNTNDVTLHRITGSGTTLATSAPPSPITDDRTVIGTVYYYSLSAPWNGNTIYSNQVSVTAGRPPDTPTGVTATAQSPGTSIHLTWTPGSTGGCEPVTYNVYGSSYASGTFEILAKDLTTPEYTQSSLPPGTWRFYRVSAQNPTGGSAQSDLAYARTWDAATPPTKFHVQPGDKQLVLTWSGPSSSGGGTITGYRLSGAHPGDSMTVLHDGASWYSPTASGYTYPHTGLTYDETWDYDIEATTGVGNGGSATDSAKTFGVPAIPMHIIGKAGTAAGQIALTWQPPNMDGGYPVTKYSVFRGLSDALCSTTFLGDVTDLSTLPFVDSGLAAGITYSFCVDATNEAGPGKTGVVRVTPPERPSPPRDLQAALDTPNTKLTWLVPLTDGGSPLTGYGLYTSPDGTTYTGPTMLPVAPLSYSSLPCSASCHYYVTAWNIYGESQPSNIVPAVATFPQESIRGTTPGTGMKLKQTLNCGVEQNETINAVTGQFVASLCVMTARSEYKGMNLTILATHRSDSLSSDFIGKNWFLSIDRRLDFVTQGIILNDGTGRLDGFLETSPGVYKSPPGFYETLTPTASGYDLVHVGGITEKFDSHGLRTKVEDVFGNSIRFSYADGKIVEITDAHDRITRLQYDGDRLATITDFDGRVTEFAYGGDDLAGIKLPAATADGPATTHEFTYTPQHNVRAVKDPAGHVYITNSYDALDRVSDQSDGTSSFRLTYTPSQSTTTVTDRNGNIVGWGYSGVLPIFKKTYMNRGVAPDQLLEYDTSFTTTADLEISQILQADGIQTSFTFDSAASAALPHGNLRRQEIAAPSGAGLAPLVATYDYEPLYQNVRSVTAPEGNDATYVPQNGGSTSPARYTTTYYYGDDEVTMGDLNGDGIATGEPHGRPVRIVHPLLNPTGSPSPLTDGYQPQIECIQYNAHGQETQHIYPDGRLVGTLYYKSNGIPGDPSDQEGFVFAALEYWDADTSSCAPLSSGSMAAMASPAAPESDQPQTPVGEFLNWTYTYDNSGNLLTQTDPTGNVTTFEYDRLNRMTRTVLPGPAKADIKFSYDADGNLVTRQTKNSVQLPDGSIATDPTNPYLTDTFAYDALDRRTDEWLSAARPTGAIDSTTALTLHGKFGYDKNGNLVMVRRAPSAQGIDGNDATTYIYDERNQMQYATTGGLNPLFSRLAANNQVTTSGLTDPFTLYLHDTAVAKTTAQCISDTQEWTPGDIIANPGKAPQIVCTSLYACTTGCPAPTCVSVPPKLLCAPEPVCAAGSLLGLSNPVDVTLAPPTLTANPPPCVAASLGDTMDPAWPTNLRPQTDPILVPDATGGASARLVVGETPLQNAKVSWTYTPSPPLMVQDARIMLDFWAMQTDTTTTPNTWKARLYSGATLLASNDPVAGTTFSNRPIGEAHEYRIALGTASFTVSSLRLEVEAVGAQPGRLVLMDSPRAPSRLEIGTAATTSNDYDAGGRILQQSDSDARTTRNEYDGMGRPTTMTAPDGTRTVQTYDASGRVVDKKVYGATSGIGFQTTPGPSVLLAKSRLFYDEAGRLFRTDVGRFDPTTGTNLPDAGLFPGDGFASTLVDYDAGGHPIKVISDTGATHEYQYSGLGRLTWEKDVGENEATYSYGANGRPMKIDVTMTELGPAGTWTLPAHTVTTLLSYDSAGHLVRTVDILGQARRAGYDSRGNVAWTTDTAGPLLPDAAEAYDGFINADGNVVSYSYDGNNRLIEVRRDLHQDGTTNSVLTGYVYTFQDWDADGRLAAITDDMGHKTTYTYDRLNNVLRETMADGTATNYLYDATGHAVRRTDALGNAVAIGLTATGLPARAAVAGPATLSTLLTYEYDGLGRVTRATDNNNPGLPADDATTVLHYDSTGMQVADVQNGMGVSRTYDSVGLATGLTYPNGRAVLKAYDAAGRLTQVADPGTPLPNPIVNYAYGTMHLGMKDYGGMATYFGYDSAGRLAGMTGALHYSFQYDRQGSVTGEVNYAYPHESRAASYDSLGRLVDEDTSNFANLYTVSPPTDYQASHMTWELDTSNDWVHLASTHVAGTATEARSHGPVDQLRSITVDGVKTTYTTSAAGNRLTDGTQAYTWDAFNRLRSVTTLATGMEAGHYTYDALGRRTSTVTPLATTAFYYDGLNVIEERSGTGTLLRQFVHGSEADEHVVLDRNLDGDNSATGPLDERVYYLQDRMGNVVALVSSGTVRERYVYDPYGHMVIISNLVLPAAAIPVSAFDNPYTYTGQRFDSESGLFYYKARYYDAEAGRFLSRDPVGAWGTPSLGNGYSYVSNMPLQFRDATGKMFGIDELVSGFVGAASGLTVHLLTDCFSGDGCNDSLGSYVNAAVDGACLGVAVDDAPVGVGIALGATCGAIGNIAGQATDIATGAQCGPDFNSLAVDTAMGAVSGGVGAKMKIRKVHLNVGAGSMRAVAKGALTALRNGGIHDLSYKTVGKMYVATLVPTFITDAGSDLTEPGLEYLVDPGRAGC